MTFQMYEDRDATGIWPLNPDDPHGPWCEGPHDAMPVRATHAVRFTWKRPRQGSFHLFTCPDHTLPAFAEMHAAGREITPAQKSIKAPGVGA